MYTLIIYFLFYFILDADKSRVLQYKTLNKLSSEIGNGFENLGIELGLDPALIEQIKNDHKTSTQLQIFHMLKKWKEIEKDNATRDVLRKAISETSRCVTYNRDAIESLLKGEKGD